MKRRLIAWRLAALIAGVLLLILWVTAPVILGPDDTGEFFGARFESRILEPYLFAGGITLLVLALIGAVYAVRAD